MTDNSAGKWQPIDTAPHDVDVLLFCPDRGCESNRARIELGCASSGWNNEVANNMSYHSWATHWMALPQFPEAIPPPPYPFCRTPEQCAGKGYCTRDPACNN